jgi:hypothetical protein
MKKGGLAASSRMASNKTLAWRLKGVGVFMRQFYHLVREHERIKKITGIKQQYLDIEILFYIIEIWTTILTCRYPMSCMWFLEFMLGNTACLTWPPG